MSLIDEFNKAGPLVTEKVIVNTYGETANQIVNDPDWKVKYAEYLNNHKMPETCDDNRRLQFSKLRNEPE